jgi:uncharacterized protein with PIN domain
MHRDRAGRSHQYFDKVLTLVATLLRLFQMDAIFVEKIKKKKKRKKEKKTRRTLAERLTSMVSTSKPDATRANRHRHDMQPSTFLFV